MDGRTLTDRLHHLSLSLAGRIDDDAAAAVRELVAVAEQDRAVELLVGCLVAGRVPVTPGERYQLRQLLDATRSPVTLVDRLTVIDELPADPHRFHDRDEPASGLEEALRPVVDRLTGVRSVRATWRVTPAGATPGAVPARVVLVELDGEAYPAAVSYQMTAAFQAAGTWAAVEVYRTGDELPDYHRKALAAATPVHLDGVGVTPRPEPRRFRSLVPVGDTSPLEVEDEPVAEAEPPSAVEEPAATDATDDDPGTELVEDEAAEPSAVEAPAVNGSDPVPGGVPATRLPAAVDAKLTDRERNLLARLHEELAQREQSGRRESGKWQLARPSGESLATNEPAPGVGSWTTGPTVPAPNGYPHLSGGSTA
ncbi:hypothetical protein LX15_001705 [Streptoalloteichus tenebrarius]|uniref:Uncharacterized protein n=1 Tax=Streptoalloteichus tenebrarius (strain ATCC 17920 / DSM 40477 / JCM 4838 / CBS 697.72 / NBRC 16177 / NCIMB 11028 / NRRL B-12390 / A12253. 1 / ISP 5477) TaxID=1933 RepID=A0ABT1HR84_STRSD|nr:hypothetical protein [Streptoalloteichus tenebrarius]MCP2258018.1 hypothetical protein [Streptoalloteichus tenebrarius]BFF01686.1 hypothetical protein GCM10020241_33610 [Streptoalloteichus tenebrarius]